MSESVIISFVMKEKRRSLIELNGRLKQFDIHKKVNRIIEILNLKLNAEEIIKQLKD